MFTGIIETLGEVVSFEEGRESARIRVAAPEIIEGLKLGDSVAVNGACLTVAEIVGDELAFDAVRETLECTALGELATGSQVNLERALRADGRFDGHIVQGHVDGVGRVSRLERVGDDVKFHVDCGSGFARQLVDKGSVTIQGVSLTVVSVGEEEFHVVLIPHTLERTTLGQLAADSQVNLEADILGKYVKRYLEQQAGSVGAR
ncbi:MAG: riboflavin synthase [Deltaproteobacteria bacterium]|nr:riboflavin synthase [Deltaproteobacteria bacterium]MBW2419498.1 riboflavin synthase [Deltaproteobacteria bacterium]